MKDQGNTIPTPTQTSEPDGGSFLTQTPKESPDKTTPEGDPKSSAGDKSEGEGDKVSEGAPEKYEAFKLPEGYTLTDEASKEVSELFKGLNLSQDSAQKLVDYYGKNLLATAEAPYKEWANTQKEWVSEIQDRFGSKAEKVRGEINSAITNALTPSLAKAFRTALDITGAGSNPEIFEALSILARPHLEGKPVPQGKPSGEANNPPNAPVRPSAAEAMYPHLINNRPH